MVLEIRHNYVYKRALAGSVKPAYAFFIFTGNRPDTLLEKNNLLLTNS
jgi:hypothetical protein